MGPCGKGRGRREELGCDIYKLFINCLYCLTISILYLISKTFKRFRSLNYFKRCVEMSQSSPPSSHFISFLIILSVTFQCFLIWISLYTWIHMHIYMYVYTCMYIGEQEMGKRTRAIVKWFDRIWISRGSVHVKLYLHLHVYIYLYLDHLYYLSISYINIFIPT